jgi:succinyl-diaminopimelate desuccinylase
LGTVKIDGKSAKAQVDIRYPASVKPEDLSEIITKKIKPFGLKFNLLESKPVLFVSEDTPLIKLLKDAYREVTNQEAETFATGMGTYARELKNRAVSFGPIFPGEESSIHNANENIDIDKFFLHAEICLEAIYKMIS